MVHNGSNHPLIPTKHQQKCIHQLMLQSSFCWFWFLIFMIPLHQDDREDAILRTVKSALGLLGAHAVLLRAMNKNRSLDQDQ